MGGPAQSSPVSGLPAGRVLRPVEHAVSAPDVEYRF